MRKYIYFVVVKEENGKTFPQVLKLNNSLNIANALKPYYIAHYCDTKKEAEKIFLAWVEDYHNNGKLDKSYYFFVADNKPFVLK